MRPFLSQAEQQPWGHMRETSGHLEEGDWSWEPVTQERDGEVRALNARLRNSVLGSWETIGGCELGRGRTSAGCRKSPWGSSWEQTRGQRLGAGRPGKRLGAGPGGRR